MAKRSRRLSREARAASDMMTIGLFAPLVIANRLTRLAEHSARPTEAGRRENLRMTVEKPLAAIEAATAVQKEAMRAGVEMGRAMLEASLTPLAAARPVSRRVHANAKRLTRNAR